MEQYEQLLKNIFLNKTLNDIEFFDTDLRYVSPDMEQTWIVDGGVQFQLDDSFVSFAYSGELQFFNIFLGQAEDIRDDIELKGLGAREVAGINSLVGKKVTDIKAVWNFYKDLDENFEEVGEKKYMPSEILLTFNDQSFLQMAAVQYNIMDNQVINLQYNSERELLVSLNKQFEILPE